MKLGGTNSHRLAQLCVVKLSPCEEGDQVLTQQENPTSLILAEERVCEGEAASSLRVKLVCKRLNSCMVGQGLRKCDTCRTQDLLGKEDGHQGEKNLTFV